MTRDMIAHMNRLAADDKVSTAIDAPDSLHVANSSFHNVDVHLRAYVLYNNMYLQMIHSEVSCTYVRVRTRACVQYSSRLRPTLVEHRNSLTPSAAAV